MECLTEDTVLVLVQGGVPPETRGAIDEHLANCADCRAVVAEALRFFFPGPVDAVAGRQPQDLEVGARVSRYVIKRRIGMGGVGVVYEAHDPELDRSVALKIVGLHGSSASEAQAMARLSHPNVVHVYDTGTIDGQMFIAMELVAGATLADWLEQEPRRWPAIVDVFARAAEGLGAAHRAGIIHGDFKPENVLMGDDGRVLVGDFGLARRTSSPDDTAAATTVSGTPLYMAPEQLRLGRSDERSDQYSFCVAIFSALYWVHPFAAEGQRGRTLLGLASRQKVGTLRKPPPETDVPSAFLPILQRGLADSPVDRFSSMDELGKALRSATAGPPRRPGRRTIGLLVAGAASVTAAVLWLAVPGGVCGNGTIERGEECDDGNVSDGDACLTSCRWAKCGDGKLRLPVEQCDDGNLVDGDGCSRSCSTCRGGDASMYLPATGDCYYRFDRPETWDAARQICATLDGDLISYNHVAEVPGVLAGLSLPVGSRFWIGMARNGDGGALSPVRGTKPILPPWAGNEPAASGDCAFQEVSTNASSVGVAPCEQRQKFLCERFRWSFLHADNHAYSLFSVASNWFTANAACSSRGGHLATIGDAAEQSFLEGLIPIAAWIGAKRRITGDPVQWITGEPFGFSKAPPKLDLASGKGLCLLLRGDKFWEINPCEAKYPYVCEVE